MKTRIKIVLISVMLGFSACNYLDVVPDNVATIEYAFRNRASAIKFLYTCYNYKPNEGNLVHDVGMTGGDETWMHRYVIWDPTKIARGLQESYSPILNYWRGEGGANKNLWRGIRDCNIFIENIDSVIDIPDNEKKRWKAEVKFLKAYYHFYLFKLYGPIPVTDVNIPIDASVEQVKVYRDPVDDVVNYCANLMKEAADELPDEKDVIIGTEGGRVNNLVAMAMRAKVLLYGASPLFNGNTNYASIVDNRGVQLFPQEKDDTKWAVAAAACREAIEMCHQQGKELYDIVDPLVASQAEPFQIQTTYRQAICDRWNKELIWGDTNYDYTVLYMKSQAKLMRVRSDNWSNQNEWGPTIKMVEMYYSSNGVPIDEDKEWSSNGWYANRYNIRPEVSSGDEIYYVKEGEQTVYLHYNREERFYASVGFDRGIYYGSGYYKFPDNVKHLEFMSKEYTGLASSKESFAVTCYSTKKMTSFKSSITYDATTWEYYPFPIMRLADLYLMYAEALNEAEGPTDEVFLYVDKVRQRVGLKGVREAWLDHSKYPDKPNTREGMRDIIRRERTIELAFEGERFWDLRRWKEIQQLNIQPLGWDALGETPEDFYRLTNVSSTIVKFSVKNYLWPIRDLDLVENRNLVQNYGW